MSAETNTNLVRRFHEALEKSDYETLTSTFHDDFVFYSQVDTPARALKVLSPPRRRTSMPSRASA